VTQILTQRPAGITLARACQVLGINRSSVYARRREGLSEAQRDANRSRKGCPQPRALTEAERQRARDVLYGEAYRDQPPEEIYNKLLEQGEYIGSVRTLYRLLAEDKATGERRNQRPAQNHAMPRLLAKAPNEVWTWDISKLPTTRKGPYLSLYVVMDLFSRYVLAWMVSRKENSTLAQQLMSEAVARYNVAYGSLTLHQDRGAPMIAHGYLDMLGELGVVCSHSRPRTSNDNPFSESQFKTLKYQPDYPGKFESVSQARQWCAEYFDWYNHHHHHSGLGGYTPEQVFTGRFQTIRVQRQAVLDAQYHDHPERFVKGAPVATCPPAEATINPVQPEELNDGESLVVNFPTLNAAKGRLENTVSSE
jgi:putative transposase